MTLDKLNSPSENGPKQPNRMKEEKKQFIELAKQVTAYKAQPLTNLTRRNLDITHINRKVYHILHNPYSLLNAHVNISKNKGPLTKSMAGDTQYIQLFGQHKANSLAKEFRDQTFTPSPTRRVLIEKP